MSIEVRNLTHTYSRGSAFEATALDDVSLTIRDGEFLAIVGHTGSGKSTLVQHLNGLLKPTAGQVLVDGQDINADGADKKRLRQRVGLVFQYPEYQLFEETVAKDVAFGPKNQGLSAGEIDQRVRKAIAAVQLDYDEVAARSPFDLSGGQMRRVAIAGVIAMEPEVLVLDEPAAGLDPKGRESILEMLETYHREHGKTVVMVSHSMDDVARLAERVAVMSNARLIACDTPRQIFSDARMMESIGLGIPEAAKLRDLLRAGGFDLAPDLYTENELADAICALWQSRKEAGV